MIKIKQLLSKGLFPAQVPPCFSSQLYGSKYFGLILKSKTWPQINGKKCVSVRPETYSVARVGHTRRLTAIVNPISQFHLSKTISENWKFIEKHYRKSPISLSTPVIVENDPRSISFTPLKELQEHQVLLGAGYKYVLVSDISQFFPTIYTHTIGWALDGKEIAKPKQYAKNLYPNDLGILLDRRVGSCQSNQTIGIPIGPDTSHIVAEIIGTGIDTQLISKLGYVPSGYRFVDDYYLFFSSKNSAEDALAKLSSSMAHFELKINSIKTKIIEVSELSEETWKYALQQFQFKNTKKKQRHAINYYFDLAFKSAKGHLDENVMIYAIRRLKGIVVKNSNWDIFEGYLYKVILSYSNCVQDIAHIIYTYHHYGYEINLSKLTLTINQLILDHAVIDHHSEVAWALWLAKELKIKINSHACDALNQSKSSVCLILAYSLELDGLLQKSLDTSKFSDLLDPKELWRTNWLLAYESGIRNWMGARKDLIDSDAHFGVLSRYKISFYDPSIKLEPVFRPKKKFDTVAEITEFIDLETTEDDDFEFLNESEDYADLRTSRIEDLFEDLDSADNESHEIVSDESDIPF